MHGIGPKKACQLLSCFDEHAVIDVLRTWLRDKEQHKPDYEAFSDVQLKKEMAHFGMKELSRRQMVCFSFSCVHVLLICLCFGLCFVDSAFVFSMG